LRFRLEKTKKSGADIIILGKNFFRYIGNLLRETKAETKGERQ
jgi:hypothetical protein